MSVTITKTDRVTVYTLTSDPESACPPLCQILKGLCYSPACCSVSQHLRTIQGASQSVLGALHIIAGLLNIGIGSILYANETLGHVWLGGLFILFGIIGILSEKYPSPCLVILNVILNLTGVGFAIAAIILYTINMLVFSLWDMCYEDRFIYPDESIPTESPQEMKKCYEGRELILMLVIWMNAVLIVLSVLEFCVSISCAVLGIKALKSSNKKENKSIDDPQHCSPLLVEVTSKSPA